MNKLQTSKIYPWIVVGLLWIVALLNYMDRQMLSTMRETMQLDITELQQQAFFGNLMAVFLWIYAVISPFAGTVADRINRKWLIVISLGVWSLVTNLMGYCTDYRQIYWLRALMGVSEAIYIPAALSLIADYFTGSARSLAIGIHMTGLYMGQALGGFGANIANAISWQSAFQWLGFSGIVYAAVLILLLHEKRNTPPSGIKTKKISGMNKETVWKTLSFVMSNGAFWAIVFFFASLSLPGWATKNWLPELFRKSLGMPMSVVGPIATISIAASSFIGVMIGGPLSDKWVKNNLRGRIYTCAIGLALMIPSLVLMGAADMFNSSSLVTVILSALCFGVGYGMFDANNMPILCQFIPSRNRATAYGLLNTIGVAAGAVATIVLGKLADMGKLGLGFALMSGALVLALIVQLTALHPKTDNME